MASRPRRSQTRQSLTPSPAVEIKPTRIEMAMEDHELLVTEEDIVMEEERFGFSFQEEPLTAKECAEKMETFKTKEQFLESIHVGEAVRFLTKVLIGRNNEPLQCINCDRIYTSSSGYWIHFQKCNKKSDSEIAAEVEKFRSAPILWLKVPARDQEKTLKHIVGTEYKCFVQGCTKSFKTSKALINHLDSCVKEGYFQFKDRPDDFRALPSKAKNAFIRAAMDLKNGSLGCFLCGREYSFPHGLIYHIDRCGVEEALQPWKCYRCGFETKRGDSEAHRAECVQQVETKNFDTKMEAAVLSFLNDNGDESVTGDAPEVIPTSTKRRRTTGGPAPRVTARKDGTTLLRFRKSTVNRQFNGIVTQKDQNSYEETCQAVFETWKTDSDNVAFCNRLQHILMSEWKTENLESTSQFYPIFSRQSVTIATEKAEGLQATVPEGIRIDSRKSEVLDRATVAYCGAPINGIQVAPGKASDASGNASDDVICVTTFANETNFESNSSVVQFWRHRLTEEDKSELNLWFLLHIPNHGTILSMTWLQKHDTSEPGLIGFVAFSTTIGRVLIYRIDSSNVNFDKEAHNSLHTVPIVTAEPHLILKLPKADDTTLDESFLNATIKVEGEEVVLPMQIDESVVPLTSISWSAHGGGGVLAAITALGSIAIWNLDDESDNPRIHIDPSWNSPPTEISFLNFDHLVIGFKERIVRVVNIDTWDVKLEDSTMKTAGTRVHADSRILHSFLTWNSEYNSFPYSNAMSVSYINMDMDSMNLILIPTANTHQLMIWDVAMCAPLGTLVSCGVDGRLVASATGRLLKNMHHPFFANRNLLQLKRRRVLKMEMKMAKIEGESAEKEKEQLEESIVEHDDVCRKMWLDIGFDQVFEPTRVELSCRDQRIESLNCVDATTNATFPVSFTGGEAGLMFAVPSKLLVQQMDL
ncbi:unnamed protein product [Caenorhabditis nigoni]